MGGYGSAFLPGIGPQPRQGARPAPGWGLLGGSGSAPATRTPAATRELRVHPCGHLEAPHVHFQGHQGALRVHLVRSPGTQVCTPTDRLIVPCVQPSETWDCSATPRRDAAEPTPPTPGLCALRERREQLGGGRQGAPETARPPFTCSRPWAGAEAAAAERTLPVPPHAARAAPGQWVRWSVVDPRVARPLPQGTACQGRRRRGKRAPQSLALQPHHGWHEATVCILHLSALPMRLVCAGLWLPHPKDVQEHRCAHWALNEASPFPGGLHPFVVGITGSMPFLAE